jgi:predicted esterase
MSEPPRRQGRQQKRENIFFLGVLGVLAVFCFFIGCAGPAPAARPAAHSLGAAPAGPADRKPPETALAPLSAPDPFIDLAVPGHRPAVVVLPLGATSRRPILVATHGAGGRPEAHCRFWKGHLKHKGFILCPRGYPLNTYLPPEEQGFFYPDHHSLEHEVRAAFSALRDRFPAYIDDRGPVYAGYSQGANMGVLFFAKKPALFERAILIEGGFDDWNFANARAFLEGGARRVLFACGRLGCLEPAKRSSGYLNKVGLDSRVVYGEGAGHTYGGAVELALREALPWLFEGDSRWQ